MLEIMVNFLESLVELSINDLHFSYNIIHILIFTFTFILYTLYLYLIFIFHILYSY